MDLDLQSTTAIIRKNVTEPLFWANILELLRLLASDAHFPEPCEDQNKGSTLHHRSTGVKNWGFYTTVINHTIRDGTIPYYTIAVLESRIGGSLFGASQGSWFRTKGEDCYLGLRTDLFRPLG